MFGHTAEYNMLITPRYEFSQRAGTAEYDKWYALASGSLTANTEVYAKTFLSVAGTKSWFNKVLYLLPCIGSGSAAGSASNGVLAPLIDRKNMGLSGGTGSFYYSENVGLKNPGTSVINPKYTLQSLHSGSNIGGIGVYSIGSTITNFQAYQEANAPIIYGGWMAVYAKTSPDGISSTFGTTNREVPNVTGSFGTGNYYTTRTAADNNDLRLYYNGTLAGNRDYDDSGAGLFSRTAVCPHIFARARYSTTTPTGFSNNTVSTIAAAYITDGTLTDAEVLDLHNTIHTYLVQASGKV